MTEREKLEDGLAALESQRAVLGDAVVDTALAALRAAGDSLLAAFGAMGAREDDPERAVRAGLGILEEATRVAAEVRARHGHDDFNVRVGVRTGPVLLGGGVDAEGPDPGQGQGLAHVARVEAGIDAGDDPNAAPALLWACHTVLAAAKSPRAEGVLTRAHAVLTEGAGLLDEADRATFLGNMPAHRAIKTAWASSSSATTTP